jgi:hypothetical protein
MSRDALATNLLAGKIEHSRSEDKRRGDCAALADESPKVSQDARTKGVFLWIVLIQASI